MAIILIPLIQLIDYGLKLYIWAIVIYTLLNMCISFQMVNPYNQFIKVSEQFLSRIIDPVLNRIRRIVPFFGSVDLSPLILIFMIYLIQGILNQILIRL